MARPDIPRFTEPRFERLLEAWDFARGDAIVPTRQQLTLTDLLDVSEFLAMVRWDNASKATILFTGAVNDERLGIEGTGVRFDDLISPALSQRYQDIGGALLRHPCAFIARIGPGPAPETGEIDPHVFTNLYVPVETGIDDVWLAYHMGLRDHDRTYERKGAEIFGASVWLDVTPVDIGAGVPFGPVSVRPTDRPRP